MATVAEVVGAIVTAAGAAYMVGEHFGYSGQLKNDWYQQNKWLIRAGVCVALGAVGGAVFRAFELGFYSTLK